MVKPHGDRASELFREHEIRIYTQTSFLFAILMILQWVGGVTAALVFSPRTWVGAAASVHIHVWLAIFLGGAITGPPVYMALRRPHESLTRHTIAVCQMMMSALLIHLTGGRIETHFHVFGSLAFLAYYRDWRTLIPATVVVAADHAVRGIYFPESVFGTSAASQWRWVEHACWVIFEDIILIKFCIRARAEMWEIARGRAATEAAGRELEDKVRARTQELECAKEAAEAASRAKSEFLANISHEIRTPINGMLNMTELALHTNLAPQQREYLEIARNSAGSLLAVVNDVLDFSRIEAQQLSLDPVVFEPRELVSEAAAPFRLRAQQKGLRFECSVDALVPDLICADEIRVFQVLSNLIDNALKFTQNGAISVSLEAAPAGADMTLLEFSVCDSGIGILPEKQRLIFEAFAQADGSSTRRYGGTGLGLTISIRLVELMGGRLWVESQPDCGSTFRFTLPAKVSHRPAPQEPRRVLIAEDNPVNQRVALALLRADGHEVSVVSNGREALESLKRAHFDIVLMDIQMPEMDGHQATAAIRQWESRSGEHIPIIAMTAHTMPADREKCFAVGMDAFVAKPVRKEELREAIRRTARTAAIA